MDRAACSCAEFDIGSTKIELVLFDFRALRIEYHGMQAGTEAEGSHGTNDAHSLYHRASTARDGDEGVWSRLSLHEFLVDFLGGLVPGLLFVGALICSLIPASHALARALQPGVPRPDLPRLLGGFIQKTQNTPNMIWIAAFVSVIMLSYVIGHLFYRRDPKEPDRRSFMRLKREAAKSDGKEPDVQWLKDNFACDTDENCQFPYPYMNAYLRARNHEHLACIADKWSDDRGSGRSKTYVNRLKMRLAYWNPSKYRPVVRNEAHVRLATSTWYMSQSLLKVTTFVSCPVLLVAILVALVRREGGGWAADWLYGSMVPTLIVIAAAFFSRRNCEAFIHYQRLREVFAVLELAYTAHHRAPILGAEFAPPESLGRMTLETG
jgi:hypothetical protein